MSSQISHEFVASYEDLVSGDSLPMAYVGHIRSPLLSEMRPSSGIGWQTYNLFIFFLRSGKEQFEELFKLCIGSDDNLFNAITSDKSVRDVFEKAFDFFIVEHVAYSEDNKLFLVTVHNDSSDKESIVGIINNENFEMVRSAILLVNYITGDKTNVKTKHSNSYAEQKWAEVQRYLAQQKAVKKEDDTMTIGNMLSKLCSIHPSINYTNVFNLTVFQFYDTFFQCCYMRSIAFTEAVVSTNGSKSFKYSDWLKPIQTY